MQFVWTLWRYFREKGYIGKNADFDPIFSVFVRFSPLKFIFQTCSISYQVFPSLRRTQMTFIINAGQNLSETLKVLKKRRENEIQPLPTATNGAL